MLATMPIGRHSGNAAVTQVAHPGPRVNSATRAASISQEKLTTADLYTRVASTTIRTVTSPLDRRSLLPDQSLG
jgi:hypothetical protein